MGWDRIRYSPKDSCWFVEVWEGIIACDSKQDARRFLRRYHEVGMLKAMHELCE